MYVRHLHDTAVDTRLRPMLRDETTGLSSGCKTGRLLSIGYSGYRSSRSCHRTSTVWCIFIGIRAAEVSLGPAGSELVIFRALLSSVWVSSETRRRAGKASSSRGFVGRADRWESSNTIEGKKCFLKLNSLLARPSELSFFVSEEAKLVRHTLFLFLIELAVILFRRALIAAYIRTRSPTFVIPSCLRIAWSTSSKVSPVILFPGKKGKKRASQQHNRVRPCGRAGQHVCHVCPTPGKAKNVTDTTYVERCLRIEHS